MDYSTLFQGAGEIIFLSQERDLAPCGWFCQMKYVDLENEKIYNRETAPISEINQKRCFLLQGKGQADSLKGKMNKYGEINSGSDSWGRPGGRTGCPGHIPLQRSHRVTGKLEFRGL